MISGLPVTCQDDEFAVFAPPSGQTCQEWAGAFVQAAGGYLNNPDSTVDCQYCQYRVGDEYLASLNMSYGNRWRDVWVLFGFIVFNAAATVGENFWRCSQNFG